MKSPRKSSLGLCSEPIEPSPPAHPSTNPQLATWLARAVPSQFAGHFATRRSRHANMKASSKCFIRRVTDIVWTRTSHSGLLDEWRNSKNEFSVLSDTDWVAKKKLMDCPSFSYGVYCTACNRKYGVLILSDNYRLSLLVNPFILLMQPTQPTVHMRIENGCLRKWEACIRPDIKFSTLCNFGSCDTCSVHLVQTSCTNNSKHVRYCKPNTTSF
jgi:hypothetical protein